MLYKFFTHTHTGICHPVMHHNMFLIHTRVIADFKVNAATVLCKLHSIAQDIHQHFSNTHSIRQHIRRFRCFYICMKCNITIRQKSIHDTNHRIGNSHNIHRNRHKFDFTALNSTDVQYIVDKCQQMLGTFSDFFQTAFYFRFWIMLHSNIGKANNRIHRSSDIMRHIVQKCSLGTTGILRSMNCILKLLINYLIPGTVGQIHNVFLFTLNVRAKYNHTKPSNLTCLLMDIFPIPFTLFSRLNC